MAARVLVVDDHDDARELLRLIVEHVRLHGGDGGKRAAGSGSKPGT